jgi:hypothetical protein
MNTASVAIRPPSVLKGNASLILPSSVAGADSPLVRVWTQCLISSSKLPSKFPSFPARRRPAKADFQQSVREQKMNLAVVTDSVGFRSALNPRLTCLL